jgi:hypothetical protein
VFPVIITIPRLRNHENPVIRNSGTVLSIAFDDLLQRAEKVVMFDPLITS